MSFGIAKEIFTDKRIYLATVNEGVPGAVVKSTVSLMPAMRNILVNSLGITSSNLSRLYPKKALNRQQSEEILDILRIYNEAVDTFQDAGIAVEWLNTEIPALDSAKPIDLFDTFVGRSMVSDALCTIKTGDFS